MRRILRLMMMCAVPAMAWADDSLRLSQYGHSVWRVQDGTLSSAPIAIGQTRDGYLWIGTSEGLFRFDGVRMNRWTSGNKQSAPAPTAVFSLHGASDGTLWIGGNGLMRLREGVLFRYTEGLGRVASIVEDARGSIWYSRTRPAEQGGALCQVTGDHIRCYGAADGLPFPAASVLIAGADDSFWLGSARGLLNWKPGSPREALVPSGLQSTGGLSGIGSLAAASDGSVWVGMTRSGPGAGLQRIQDGKLTHVDVPTLDGGSLVVAALVKDRENAMWIGTDRQGIYRVVNGRVDQFLKADGLSSDSITDFFEDREGNVWVATAEGLDCFRKTRVVTYSLREGLRANQAASVLAAHDGAIWIGNQGALDVIRAGRIDSIDRKAGLPGNDVTALFQDRAGRIWVGVDDGLAVNDGGAFRSITRSDGRPLGPILTITEDHTNNIWVEVLGNPRRLVRIADSRVREDLAHPQVPAAASLTSDPNDGIWMGLDTGEVARYRNGTIEKFPIPGSRAAVRQITAAGDGSVLALTSIGLVGLRGSDVRSMAVENGLPCANAYSFIYDAQGGLWLYTPCGLVMVPAIELQKWWKDGKALLDVRVFDAVDGARPAQPSFEPHASRSSDGRLWFVNDSVVQVIDPAFERANPTAPPVYIEQLIADRKSYNTSSIVQLPPLTRDLQIDFVGLSFIAPQKVMFRYRLEGRDDEWQEAGTRRQAFYSDLRPGNYRFRVVARNSDGLWNEEGASVAIVVAPAWYQTRAFLLITLVIAIASVWAVYQLRVRQVARALNARFDERLAERTRVARDLHDTLLQTVQGSKMVVDNALMSQGDRSEMHRAMEQVSAWLGQAAKEGRDAVDTLRTSTIETNDLAAALRRAIEDCQRHGKLQPALAVTGQHRDMHPVARDEVYRIAYEAIRNACTHSGGNHLEVEVAYARDLTIRVSDDGVGMDPAVAKAGRQGHFGLQGMRERAERIGATLEIAAGPNGGTIIALSVPGRVIFRRSELSLIDRIRNRF